MAKPLREIVGVKNEGSPTPKKLDIELYKNPTNKSTEADEDEFASTVTKGASQVDPSHDNDYVGKVKGPQYPKADGGLKMPLTKIKEERLSFSRFVEEIEDQEDMSDDGDTDDDQDDDEDDQIDEVSKDKLAKYIDKAHDDGAHAHSAADTAWRENNRTRSERLDKISDKRAKGISSAVKKLAGKAKVVATEEVEQVDEISSKTLGSYINKAHQDAKIHSHNAGADEGMYDDDDEDAEYAKRKEANRAIGTRRATARLVKRATANEEVEQVNEISPATAKDYIAKARASRNASKEYMGRSDLSAKVGDPDYPRAKPFKGNADEYDKHFSNVKKRGAGIKKAAAKLKEWAEDEEDEDVAHYKERIAHHEAESDKHRIGSKLETLHSHAASDWKAALKHHQEGNMRRASEHVQSAKNYEDDLNYAH